MLLTQNREMRADKVWNFTLPAWVIELPDGSHMNVCPNAGACAKFCYARNGTYLFPKVKGKHLSNLLLVRDDPNWTQVMSEELSHKRFQSQGEPRVVPGLNDTGHLSSHVQGWLKLGGRAIRIHDSGDFFNETYLQGWIFIAEQFPGILFYAYTKEVLMLKNHIAGGTLPPNFLVVFSMGGKQDHHLNLDEDRHADVFPDLEAIEAAGYMSQHESDLLSVLLPTTRIGIPQNNIPHFKKRLEGRTFSQAQRDRKRRDSRD
jgi:hypothetical protein